MGGSFVVVWWGVVTSSLIGITKRWHCWCCLLRACTLTWPYR